jgi:hypothetical protein
MPLGGILKSVQGASRFRTGRHKMCSSIFLSQKKILMEKEKAKRKEKPQPFKGERK